MTLIGNPSGRGFEQYTGEVYGWAYRLLGRHHDALDVVQDVFLRWDAQCARQAPKQPRGWLRRVTLNRVIDLRRQRQRIAEPQASACAESTLAETRSPQDVGMRIDQEALRDDITTALDRLSDVQRSVIVAKVYDDMTFAQVAEELGLAVSTVKTHYLRAVGTVRDRLKRRWAEEESS